MEEIKNYWVEWASELGAAYVENAGPLRFGLVTKALQIHLSQGSKRVADIGGGFGEQAILLARIGHEVVIVDPDAFMLERAREKLEKEEACVQRRVSFVPEPGERAFSVLKEEFDLVCCHSVLMYLRDPTEVLVALTKLAGTRGIISILTVNPESIAFREGLLRNWKEAIKLIKDPTYTADRYRPNVKHSVNSITRVLEERGFELTSSYGVGVFTDHVCVSNDHAEFNEIFELEWLAGNTMPYRQIARSTHAIYRTRLERPLAPANNKR